MITSINLSFGKIVIFLVSINYTHFISYIIIFSCLNINIVTFVMVGIIFMPQV